MWQDGGMADDGHRADTVLYLPFPLCLNLAVSGVFLGCSFLSFFLFFSLDLGPLPFATKPPTPPSLACPFRCCSMRARAAVCERMIWGDLRLFYHSVFCIHIFANNALPHPLPTN
jgi:hypothetical protein